MTISIRARHRQGDFTLDATFASEGGVTALFGRSGAGKSTIAGLVSGVVRPQQARIVLDHRVLVDTEQRVFVPQRRRQIGVVFQEARLFPHLSVRQNLLFGQRYLPTSERTNDIDPVLKLLGIEALLERRPRSLSGGEQQRVAIGRALLTAPRALILDEPLASIDQARRAEILPYLDRVRSETRIPIIYISHAVEEIARLADTVVVVDAGQVLAAGPTADILGRLDLAPLAEAEHSSILVGKVASLDPGRSQGIVHHPAGALIVPGLEAPVGSNVRIRISARDVALAVGEPGRISIRNRLPATVGKIDVAKTGVDVKLDIAGSNLLARLTAEAVDDLELKPGSKVTALIKAVAVEGY